MSLVPRWGTDPWSLCRGPSVSAPRPRAPESCGEPSIHSFIHSFAQHRLLCPAAGCALCPGETERQCSRAGGATDTGGWSPLMGGVAEHKVGGTMEMGPKALPEGQPRFSRRAWGQSTFHPRWTQSHSPEAFLPRLSPQTRGRSQSSLLAECHCPHLGSIDTRTG